MPRCAKNIVGTVTASNSSMTRGLVKATNAALFRLKPMRFAGELVGKVVCMMWCVGDADPRPVYGPRPRHVTTSSNC